MKSLTNLLMVITISLSISTLGCSAARKDAVMLSQSETVKASQERTATPQAGINQLPTKQLSLNDADSAATTTAATDRKIIRNADLTMEVSSPFDAQRTISSIAEQHGGFIVTSESKQRSGGDAGARLTDIKLVARVPANQFDNAVSSIEKLSTNIINRNVSGQDVTEEFIDLDARIRTQKALELQFLEIMKQAHKVSDALEVQSQIADVRTEIEKLEGRKRFLENNTSLSTIVVNLQAPLPIVVNTSGFGRSVREAVSESIDVAAAILLFLVRFVIVMLPVFAFVILPTVLMARYLVRRIPSVRLTPKIIRFHLDAVREALEVPRHRIRHGEYQERVDDAQLSFDDFTLS